MKDMKYIAPKSEEIRMEMESCLAVSLQHGKDADPNADVLSNKKNGGFDNPIWDK